MPNESSSAAQNKMGELYVDFGTKGAGGLLKSLNGIKAQFLLTKTAAEQAIKPLVGMSKGAAGGVTELNKLNAVTGLSIKQLQDLKIWSELNNISFGELAGQIQNMQRNLLDIRLGRGDVSGYQLLGLDPSSLDYRKPMEAFSKIRERVQQVDAATGALALRQLGFSEDLLYAFKQSNNQFDQRLKLNNKEIDSLNKQQRAWNTLSTTWNQAQSKFIANQGWIVNLLEKTTNAIEQLNMLMAGSPEQRYEAINQGAGGLFQNTGHFLRSLFLFDLDPNKSSMFQNLGMNMGKELSNYFKYTFSGQKASLSGGGTVTAFPTVGSSSSQASWQPQNFNTNNSSYNSNNTVNVNQYITGNNAQEIANTSQSMMLNQLNNIEMINTQGR